MCDIITHIDTYKTPPKALCATKLKECIPWPFCNTKLKQWESTAENPPHCAPIINMLISMYQLLKMILGTTYWIFNLQIINQIGCNGSEQWGPHVSWAGKGDACRQQCLKFWWDELSYPGTRPFIGSWELEVQEKEWYISHMCVREETGMQEFCTEEPSKNHSPVWKAKAVYQMYLLLGKACLFLSLLLSLLPSLHVPSFTRDTIMNKAAPTSALTELTVPLKATDTETATQ